MARIRTIKPETFTSESIAALTLATRWTFVGLWTYVDDEGRAQDNAKIIRGALWPNDEDTVSSRDVERHLDELDGHDMVCRYESGGRRYLHVVNFKKHQRINRATPSKLPPCYFHDLGGDKEHSPQNPDGSLNTHAQLSEPSNGVPAASKTSSRGGARGGADPFEPEPVDNCETPDQTPSYTTHAQLSEDSPPHARAREVEQGTGNREQGTGNVSETAAPPPDATPRPDVDRICDHLAARIERNGSKPPKITDKWRTAARLMLDADGRAEADIHAAIDWCQNDEFWRGNVLSLPKLREKYEQLRLQASRQPARHALPGAQRPATTTLRLQQADDALAELLADRAAGRPGLLQTVLGPDAVVNMLGAGHITREIEP